MSLVKSIDSYTTHEFVSRKISFTICCGSWTKITFYAVYVFSLVPLKFGYVSGAWKVVLIQYIPINMHTVFALMCFVVVIHWLIFPYPSGLLHWHCGNLTIAPVPTKQPWWIWINTSCEFIMNDCITTTKQNTTKPCAFFLGYTVLLIRTYRDVWNRSLSVTKHFVDFLDDLLPWGP